MNHPICSVEDLPDQSSWRTSGSAFPAAQSRAAENLPKRILVADDDAFVRGSLAAVLELEGFIVDEAYNGIEAVTRALEYSPDLVLLDLHLPHWDGWTAFRHLDRIAPLLPVIIITARPNEYRAAMRLGADAFMEKPLNIPVLVEAVKRLISEDKSRHQCQVLSRSRLTQFLGRPTTDNGRSAAPSSRDLE